MCFYKFPTTYSMTKWLPVTDTFYNHTVIKFQRSYLSLRAVLADVLCPNDAQFTQRVCYWFSLRSIDEQTPAAVNDAVGSSRECILNYRHYYQNHYSGKLHVKVVGCNEFRESRAECVMLQSSSLCSQEWGGGITMNLADTILMRQRHGKCVKSNSWTWIYHDFAVWHKLTIHRI